MYAPGPIAFPRKSEPGVRPTTVADPCQARSTRSSRDRFTTAHGSDQLPSSVVNFFYLLIFFFLVPFRIFPQHVLATRLNNSPLTIKNLCLLNFCFVRVAPEHVSFVSVEYV